MKKLLLLACFALSGAPMFADAKLDALKQQFQQLDPEFKKIEKITADLKALLQPIPKATKETQNKEMFLRASSSKVRSAASALNMGKPPAPSRRHIEDIIDEIRLKIFEPQQEIQRAFVEQKEKNLNPRLLHYLESDIAVLTNYVKKLAAIK